MSGLSATRTGDPARRPRLDEVAAAAGVSTATVSLVLREVAGPSPATRERVLAEASRLGYRPDRAASLLASHRSRSIGVVLDIGNAFHAELAQDLLEAAEQRGYDLVLSPLTRSRAEDRAIETLMDSRCEGLVLLGTEASSSVLAELARQVPVVAVGRPGRIDGVGIVRAADDQGVELAVGHLATLGHQRIAYVDGGRGVISSLRRRGFRRAMKRLGRSADAVVVPGGQDESAGADAARVLLTAHPAPTAVLTFNDRCALGLLDALLREGVDVPGDLSLVGYDDSPMARLAHIDLTTVSQNSPELARHAIAALAARLESEATEPGEVVVTPQLVVRGSTSRPAR